ncbi:hypothetical protein Trydic_g12951 [Trypoxylus dichotomus]
METEEFQLPSARQQRKRKSSRNSSSEYDRRKRSGTKPAPAGESQLVKAAVPNLKAKDAHVPPVVLREKARWMAFNAELSQQGVRTTRMVNTNVGIRIHPATAANYRHLIKIVSDLKVQYHSYQLTDTPRKVVIRGVSEEITEDGVTQGLARQGLQHTSCKGMVVGAARRPIALIFVQMAKSEESKRISVTHICGINVE